MKTTKIMKTITAAAVLLAASTLSAAAQVGINTVTPDSSALLDVRYSGAGKAVGVLLPDLNAGERAAKKNEVSKGMIVFDRTEGLLYYFDSTEWVAANPLVSVNRDNGFTDIRPQNAAVNQQNMSLGLPPSEAATAKLDVNGSARVRQNLKVDGSDTVAGSATVRQSLQVGGRGSFAANVRVAGTDSVNKLVANSSVVNGNSEVTGTLTANTLAGYGTIPVGGIIMWSGTTAPDGWALCNGQTVNGKTTPNLQGRFIVGYQSSGDADYNSIGKTGGEKTHTLTINEMPSHSHIYSYTPYSSNKTSNTHDTDHRALESRDEETSYAGGGAAHENRPPYYVLAFIMRVQ
ncbi:MAG: tail fiber protein [Prevotellaceae bacterium]|jgi:microcystin-dependent protein|nr:tail fiber protein [Prevotellaceae bacterium]